MPRLSTQEPLFKQGCESHSLISVRQKGPVNPTGHWQVKELIPSTQVPPLKQELQESVNKGKLRQNAINSQPKQHINITVMRQKTRLQDLLTTGKFLLKKHKSDNSNSRELQLTLQLSLLPWQGNKVKQGFNES